MTASLQEGDTEQEGTVMLNGKFVCSDDWDILDAQVACRELGYIFVIHVKEREKNESETTGYTKFSCSGDEPNLSACIHLETNQTCSYKLAAVECSHSEKGKTSNQSINLSSNSQHTPYHLWVETALQKEMCF